ncbi:hypothetical protein Tco_0178661 [Tanacetum coccineum]
MVDSKPMEEEFQGVTTRDVGTETYGEPTKPVLQTQKTPSPSPAFIKENIDVLRTMIKEHDQQAKMKATPRKLAYGDSDKEAPASSLANGFSDRFSLESSGTSDTYRQTHSANKKRKDPNPEEKGPDTKRQAQTLNMKKDPEDLIGIFSVVACLRGLCRCLFGAKCLQAFMDRFKSESSHIKGVPPVLRISAFMHGHGHPELAKKLNDKIPQTVDEMFERVRAIIKGEVAVGSAEMVRPSQGDKGYVRPAWPGMSEKNKNGGSLREVRRNMGVYTPYPRKDTFTPLIKTSKEILAMESVSFPEPPPLIGAPEKQNLNKFYASAKLTRAELSKHSGDADLSKDKSGLESPPEFHRSWRAELPHNIRVYEGNKDPEDHLGIFSAAPEQEEWPS